MVGVHDKGKKLFGGKSQRLEANAQRNSQHRADENDDARTQRLEADAQRHVQQRANENDDKNKTSQN